MVVGHRMPRLDSVKDDASDDPILNFVLGQLCNIASLRGKYNYFVSVCNEKIRGCLAMLGHLL